MAGVGEPGSAAPRGGYSVPLALVALVALVGCVGTDVDEAPDGGIAADAGMDATLSGPCTRTWIDMLNNGHFDEGVSARAADTNGGDIVREEGAGYPWSTHSGTWGAILLGYDNGAQTLSQTVTVPISTTRLRLQAYGCFVTEETTTDIAYDTLSIELRTGLATREVLAAIDNTAAGAICNWQFMIVEAAEPYAGETMTLAFGAASDGASITSFGFDTLSLEALACP